MCSSSDRMCGRLSTRSRSGPTSWSLRPAATAGRMVVATSCFSSRSRTFSLAFTVFAPSSAWSVARIEGVEREHDAGVEGGQPPHVGLVEQLQAVGGDGEPADAGRPAHLEELGQLGVQGGLAAREVDDVQLGVIREQVVEDLLHALAREAVGAVVLVHGVADRTVEVAGRGDGHHGQVDLLLVRGAGTAVEGAALVHRLHHARAGDVRGGHEGQAVEVPLHAAGHQHHLLAVGGAELVEADRLVLEDDLGVHRLLAGAAQALGHRVVDVVGGRTHGERGRVAHHAGPGQASG